VLRSIVGFRPDEESQWVAELACGHARHVRHDPPFSERAWTRTPEGRAARLGSALECARCDARELPEGWREYRRTPAFTHATAPEALRTRHTTKPGVWARIHVVAGALRYLILDPFEAQERLAAGDVGIVLPETGHRLEIEGPVEFFVAFYRRAAPEAQEAGRPAEGGRR